MTVTAAVVEGDPFTPTSLVATLRVDTLALEPGPHTLQVQGVGADGFIRAVNVGVVVAPESCWCDTCGSDLAEPAAACLISGDTSPCPSPRSSSRTTRSPV